MNYRGCVFEGASANQSNSPSYSRPDREIRSPRLHCLTSPRCKRTIVQIARLLQLPAPELVENPLDAANAGIRLGKPVSSKRVRAYRALVVLLACSLAIPLIFALWSGKLSAFGIAVGSFGGIMAFLLIRHLYRASGCWIVRDGDLRIERLSLMGTIEVITVGGDDVAYIDVESGGRRGLALRDRDPAPLRKKDPQPGAGRQGPDPRRAGRDHQATAA